MDSYTALLPLLLESVSQSNILIKILNLYGREKCTGCELFIESKTLQILLSCRKRN